MNLEFEQMKRAVQWALAEDIGSGDITSLAILPEKKGVNGRFLAKAPGIIAGLEIAQLIFCLVDERVEFVPLVEDGDAVEKGDVIATITGLGQSVLSGERVALNFLQRMSGIATMTLAFVTAVQPLPPHSVRRKRRCGPTPPQFGSPRSISPCARTA